MPFANPFPTGKIDFTKPLKTGDDEAVTIDYVLPKGDYPVVAYIDGYSDAEFFDGDGYSQSGDFTLIQDPEVVYGRLLRDDDGDLLFDEEVYHTEADAKKNYAAYSIVSVFPVSTGTKTAEATSGDEDAAETVVLNGRTIRVGDTVRFRRPRHGTRNCRVVKMRNDPRSALYVDPQDGNNPYWALNRNIR